MNRTNKKGIGMLAATIAVYIACMLILAFVPIACENGGATTTITAVTTTTSIGQPTTTATNTTVTDPFTGSTQPTLVAYDDEAFKFLELINEYRVSNGLSELYLSEAVSEASLRHSKDMANYEFFSHTTEGSDYFPIGSTPWDRMADSGYDYNTDKGENIAEGYPNAQEVFEAWRGSEGHNRNMLNPAFNVIGIGLYELPGSRYTWYWTTDFGGYVDPTAYQVTYETTTTTQAPATTTTSTTTTTENNSLYTGSIPMVTDRLVGYVDKSEGELQYLKTFYPNAKLTVSPEEIVTLYNKWGKIFNIRADWAFAQAIHETGGFMYGGLVQWDWNNYAGIGATGPTQPGEKFATAEDGVIAHYAHLACYASPLHFDVPQCSIQYDPRHNHLIYNLLDLSYGSEATTWEDLNGVWAVPGTEYAQNIVKIVRAFYK